jgi:hypothetical protein
MFAEVIRCSASYVKTLDAELGLLTDAIEVWSPLT